MLNFYHIYCKTYHNGELIHSEYLHQLLNENEIKNEKLHIEWDNVNEVFRKYSATALGFYIPKNFKTGKRKVCFYSNEFRASIRNTLAVKERTPLNIDFEIEMKKNKSVSIADILNYKDGERAIQYLIERDLSVIKGR